MCGSAPYLSLMTSTTQRPSSVLQGEEEGGNRGWTIAQLDSERETHTHTQRHTDTQPLTLAGRGQPLWPHLACPHTTSISGPLQHNRAKTEQTPPHSTTSHMRLCAHTLLAGLKQTHLPSLL